jgi:hypothetical protein
LALRPIASRQTRKVKVINGHNDETKQGIHKIIRALATILGCAFVAVVDGLAFFYSGLYDVSATTPDNPVVTWVVHKLTDASVAARLGGNHPPGDPDTPLKVMAGGQLYSQRCAICQGGPGLAQSAVAKGLNPHQEIYFVRIASRTRLKTSSSSNTKSK